MNFIKNLFNYYINHSIHVALSVYALTRITEYYLNINYNEPVDYFIFYSTIVAYNFIKHTHLISKKFRSKNLKQSIPISSIALLAAIYYGLRIKHETLVLIIPLALLTITYAVPIFQQTNLRKIPKLKIIMIALIWAATTVLIPAKDANILHLPKVWLLCLQRFLFIICLTIPFDIRDFKHDNTTLKTLPQTLGIKQTKKIGFILLSLTCLLEFIITPDQTSKLSYLFIFTITLVAIQRSDENQHKYYSSFFVEAIPIVWFLILSLN